MRNLKLERVWLKLLWVAIAVVLSGFFSACSPIERAGQPGAGRVISLQANQLIGQTFTARYAGFSGINVSITPGEAVDPNSELRFHLYTAPQQGQEIRQASLPLSQVAEPGNYRFAFAPVADSFQQDYYFTIELVGSGQVDLAAAPGDAYLDGALYLDNQPVDQQLTFLLAYDPLSWAWGMIREVGRWGALLAAAALLFIFPGWVLLSLVWRGWVDLHWIEKLGLSAGASMAFYPVLMLWTGLVGLRLGAAYAWGPLLLAAVLLIWFKRGQLLKVPKIRVSPASFWPDLAFLIILAMILFTRLWAIRNLDGSLWGDGFQHTVITQLLVDHGGLFDSWAPYAGLVSFTYHFGFHSWSAVFHWFTGLNAAQSVLWVGQLANVLAVVGLYPLARKLAPSYWAGVAAVTIAGLLLPVPMVYLNWGRYTQLAGQVVLPAAVFFFWSLLASPQKEKRLIVITALTWGGLALSHYRILILGLLFIPAYLLTRLNRQSASGLITKTLWVGAGAGSLFFPWFYNAFGGKMMGTLFGLTQKASSTGLAPDAALVGSLLMYAAPLFWALLLIALCWGLWQRNRAFLAVQLWWFFIVLAVNPGLLGLPGDSIITNFTAVIAVYIVMGVMIGALLGHSIELFFARMGSRLGRWAADRKMHPQMQKHLAAALPALLAIGLFALAAAVGGLARKNDIKTGQYLLLARPDVRAFAWVRKNTEPEARFLVNSFLAYSNMFAVGSDGGWWLSLLSGRESVIPPLNQGFEKEADPEQRLLINQTITAIQEYGVTSAQVHQALLERGITHIYIGQTHGFPQVNAELLIPEELAGSAYYQLIYHQDRVWIFKVQEK